MIHRSSNMKLLVVAVVLALLCGLGLSADLTKVPGAYGNEVVEAVINIIRESCLFAEDKRFLRRLAYVESHDGSDPKTYRPGYYGGIWQVDKDEFEMTKNQANLKHHYDTIAKDFGITWNNVKWVDLKKPLYSGIAAALYTLKLSAPNGVSWKVEEQGKFWGQNFHHGSSASNFSTLASILDSGCTYHQRADIVFVLDSSSSVNPDDFTRAKIFMQEFVKGFTVGPTQAQFALIVYSSQAKVEFYLNSHHDKQSVINAIDGVVKQSGSTLTDKAIDIAVQNVFNPIHGHRSGVVKVMLVVTDGDSDDRLNTINAAHRAHDDSIVSFSLGIGNNVHGPELKTIASNPQCTHTFKASSYEELRFVREEIQKATCIAPLYINNTFSCKVETCPPLAVLTGKTGVTMKTTVNCGGINVYLSSNNPYPSKANFEVQQTSFKNETESHYYNLIDKTLYLNIKDNQLWHNTVHNGSTGCVATITPCFGTCNTEKTVKCFSGGVEVTCDPSFFNCTDSEKWNFKNPCTSESTTERYPHPYSTDRFLMCDLKLKVYVVLCPPGEVYVSDCQQCIGQSTLTVSAGCKYEAKNLTVNPCTRENILADKMFFPYPGDATKYIHCDIWGKPWQRQCQTGMDWDQSLQTCIRITTYNPCLHHVVGTPYLYPHDCDPHKYIHCDTNHQAFTQSCQFDYVFYNQSRTCVPIGSYPGTETPVNTCHGEYHPYYTVTNQQGTTAYPGPGPVVNPTYHYETGTTNHYGYMFSSTKYAEPCTRGNIAANKLYFPYAYNNHNYIQCDLYGDAYLQDCLGMGRSFFDPLASVCVDGPVFVDTMLTRPPPG